MLVFAKFRDAIESLCRIAANKALQPSDSSLLSLKSIASSRMLVRSAEAREAHPVAVMFELRSIKLPHVIFRDKFRAN